MDLKKRGLKALSWDLVGRFSNQGVTFISSIFLSRLLLPEDFGLLAMVNVVVVISSTFVDGGFSSALIQRREVNDDHYGSVFFFNLSMGSLMTLILFLTSEFIADFYQRPEIGNIGKVISIIFIISAFGNVIRAQLQRELNFKIITYSNLFAAIVGGVVGITMAFKGFGVWSLVAQALVSPLSANIVLFSLFNWRPKMKLNFKALKELWTFGGHMFLTGILQNIFSQLDSLIIGRVFSPSKLGYYYRAKSLQNVVHSYTSSSLMSVLFPTFSRLQSDLVLYKRAFLKVYNILSFVSFYIAGLLYLSAEDIIVILFGGQWFESVEIFKIIVLGGIVYPLAAILITVISSRGNSKKYLQLETIKRVVLTPVFVIAFFFTLETFLYAYVSAGIINLLINITFVSKEIKVSNINLIQPLLPYLLLMTLSIVSIQYCLSFTSTNYFVHGFLVFIIHSCLFLGLSKILKLEGFIIAEVELIKLVRNNIK